MVPVTGHTQIAGATNPSLEALAMSAQGQELLTALVSFIQPIIRAYVPAAVNSDAAPEILSQDSSGYNWRDRKLLDALKSFIKSITPRETFQVKILQRENIAGIISKPTPLVPGPSSAFIVCDFQAIIMNKLRPHVFNAIPIRMLAFDSAGLEIRLLERREIVDHIFLRASAEAATAEFEAKWRSSTIYCTSYSPNSIFDRLVRKHSAYAILSHTWIRDTPGDVVFSDWNKRTTNVQGYSKIAKFCEVAAKNHGLNLGWMDTVCINKESSSELDESMRSMFQWYRDADVCVAYLSETETLESMRNDPWFYRGWTLQELLAPQSVRFYDRTWGTWDSDDPLPFSTITDDIQAQISSATTITATEMFNCRRGRADLIPISRKFQLAANRMVTRSEDKAYSLMGLLDVDISVAYGEGDERALYRLQRELLTTKKHPLDLFNCTFPGNSILPSTLSGYRLRLNTFNCDNGEVASILDMWTPIEPLMCTHIGVRLQVLLVPGLKDVYKMPKWIPKGKFSGTADIWFHDMLYDYGLLHQNIFNSDNAACDNVGSPPPILYMAVINFSVEDSIILFPKTCLAIPLDCGNACPGAVTQSDVIGIVQAGNVVTFQFQSSDDGQTVAMHDLELNGMQLVTLYL